MPKREKTSSSWLIGIPLLAGIVAAPVALHAAGILALSGPSALTLLYPFVEIARSSVLGLPIDIANPAAQWLMYLQFPLYGLLMASLMRSRSLLTAFGAVVFLHGAGILAAYLLAHWQNPYLG
ncbi:MAG TPA: hypothetical protein VFW25_04325 [Silvibacterium sp.]|nr:hypothetical protein [Silvibacterium sp.]